MHKHTPVLGVIAAVLLQAPPTLALELTDCQLAPPTGAARTAARCGELVLPEDPDRPDSAQISLQIAVVPARAKTAAPDPVVFIAGGPGQSALESFPAIAGAFRAINAERDIILVDQRGTGGSNPLECPEVAASEALDTEAVPAEVIEACIAELPGDPRFYTTSIAVRDLERVRETLGYATWNLYGISYGTRVAQHYLRRYPERTRSVILDGVVPPTLALGPRVSLDAQAALDLVFTRCAADEACATRFPDLATRFDELGAALTERPLEIMFPHPLTAEPTSLTLDADALSSAVRLLSYAPETVSLLPLLINTAVEGDPVPMAAQVEMVSSSLSEMIAIGMHNAVVCTEDAPFYADDDAALRDALADSYMGALQYDALIEICASWPAGVIDADFKEALVSAVPVLLLSGEADPITPPSNAELAAATLSRSRLLVGPGQGHGLAIRGCVRQLMTTFITDLDPEGLDADCIQRMRPAPFFTSFTGWEP
jgi:pimeloyl-ACP methyl ester carboxylesterase